MADQVVDTTTARAVQADVARSAMLCGWVVMRDQADYPGKVVARLVTTQPTAYVMIADTLAELQAMLPLGLERFDRHPSDPVEMLELWLPPVSLGR